MPLSFEYFVSHESPRRGRIGLTQTLIDSRYPGSPPPMKRRMWLYKTQLDLVVGVDLSGWDINQPISPPRCVLLGIFQAHKDCWDPTTDPGCAGGDDEC